MKSEMQAVASTAVYDQAMGAATPTLRLLEIREAVDGLEASVADAQSDRPTLLSAVGTLYAVSRCLEAALEEYVEEDGWTCEAVTAERAIATLNGHLHLILHHATSLGERELRDHAQHAYYRAEDALILLER